jgi:hypothetical protein
LKEDDDVDERDHEEEEEEKSPSDFPVPFDVVIAEKGVAVVDGFIGPDPDSVQGVDDGDEGIAGRILWLPSVAALVHFFFQAVLAVSAEGFTRRGIILAVFERAPDAEEYEPVVVHPEEMARQVFDFFIGFRRQEKEMGIRLVIEGFHVDVSFSVVCYMVEKV